MHDISLDRFDFAILAALQKNSALTNAELGDRVNLSSSQCSRRKARLESEGIIKGYAAKLNAELLGFGLRAITRVNLKAHSESMDESFVALLSKHDVVREAYSVSGDADYILHITTKGLTEFSDFIHHNLLPHPNVTQVRSEIILRSMKEERGLPIG
ncbi:Lrp/AsnC family transcriptional regulator [Halomonas campaniensis]|uniref:AsnC family transcriptional regulator n=1 Tax=Halomonas campaniensis TaxID=213554 RepID=A0A246S3Y7_9GAMM|nr:Lrp/AsnC family transcriptional regulator [Halomonas campaniensis]OWV31184.1 AsnC family transcriptional regulator [Halomonas campaniensis]